MWDISGLRKKSVAPGPGGLDDHLKTPGSTDLFGQVCCTICNIQYVPYLQIQIKEVKQPMVMGYTYAEYLNRIGSKSKGEGCYRKIG